MSVVPLSRQGALHQPRSDVPLHKQFQKSPTSSCAGGLELESLRRAEAFHEQNGMTALEGASATGLKRFQFTTEAAEAFVARLRNDGLIA